MRYTWCCLCLLLIEIELWRRGEMLVNRDYRLFNSLKNTSRWKSQRMYHPMPALVIQSSTFWRFCCYVCGSHQHFRFRCRVVCWVKSQTFFLPSSWLRDWKFSIILSLSGINLECRYKLMTFGIPTKILPISITGELKLDLFFNWLAARKKKDIV